MSAIKTATIEYPTSDGKPMAETDLHRDQMFDAIHTLQHRYRGDDNVYVSGNLLVYYVPGNKRKHVAPDVFVVFGVPKRKREYYLTWEEGKMPRVVIEITSKTTKREDNGVKKELYRTVFKVAEYFQFDPRADYIGPRLRGFRLEGGEWLEKEVVDSKLYSEVLGLELHVDGQRLRFFDPVAGEYLATPEERAENAEERADNAEERADAEHRRAESAEARERRLAEEINRLRSENEALRERRSKEP